MKGKRGWGSLGEDYAVGLLKKNGYKIIERNFSCKLGEIDIVATSAGTLIFTEVKTRWSKKYGSAEEAVTPWKLRRIKRVGEYYASTHVGLPKKLRIDVVAIEVEDKRVVKSRIIRVV